MSTVQERTVTGMALLGLVLAAGPGCEQEVDRTVPSAGDVESYYTITAPFEVEMRGNVAVLEVYQPTDHLRRGGSLWAKVGPYVYLFTEATRDLFADFGGLAGVRVVTRDPSEREVARALLRRDALNELTWKRALNISGNARLHGTDRVRLIERLIRWGEDHTDYRYNPEFLRR